MSSRSSKCPYIRDKDCGYPDKQRCIDADYESCFSFKCLKDCDNRKEENNGKDEARISVD